MNHDVKAVANVFYKLAREDKKYLTNLEYQKLVCTAQDLSMRTLGEPLFAGRWVESVDGRVVPRLYDALRVISINGKVRQRLETKTPPIKDESPAWKVIRAAYTQWDYEWRQIQETNSVVSAGMG